MSYLKAAHKIEEASFSKIQEIIDQEHPDIHFSDPFEEAVLKRVVFTSADFDYLYNIKFSNHVIEKILYVLRNKGTIFTDTTMVLGGFNKKLLDDLGVSYRCLVNEPEIFKEAKEKGITRSMAAVEYAAKVDGPKLFVFGDAVVGVPVGFVGAAESKLKLHESSVPSIAALGQKGGSTIAAAVINAILYQLKLDTTDYERYSVSDKKQAPEKGEG